MNPANGEMEKVRSPHVYTIKASDLRQLCHSCTGVCVSNMNLLVIAVSLAAIIIAEATDEGQVHHVTLTKEVEVPHPVPVPVPVEKNIPYPVFIPIHVKVDKPYPVKIYKPYPVPIYKDVPYKVYKDIPIPVKVGVEVPYPVKVPVLVPQPYPIYFHETVTVPVVENTYIKKPIIIEHEGGHGDDSVIADYGNGNNFGLVQEAGTGNGLGESDVHGSETNQSDTYDDVGTEQVVDTGDVITSNGNETNYVGDNNEETTSHENETNQSESYDNEATSEAVDDDVSKN